MYQIITKDCPKGWGYVKDYTGNKIFYGTIEQCGECIEFLINTGWEVKHDVQITQCQGDRVEQMV